MIIVDLLCEYAKESNWNADGSPSNDDSYYKVVQIKTNRSITEIKEEIEKDGWCKEMMDSPDVLNLFNTNDYTEDTLEAKMVLSEIGHKAV
mgnify:CR=1 FL=1